MIRNALTVDVEDYFHVSAFSGLISRSEWDKYPLRVEANTLKILDLFDEKQVKATFFILGWVAERVPTLVKEIAARGHEIACHGYSHQLVYNQSPKIFREETIRSKSLLEDIAQCRVYGYRAASYSIIARSKWALDILVDVGFVYDSSIFPVRHDLYGIPGATATPHVIQTPNGQSLIEFPLSSLKIMKYRLPVGGGGYFRLYPYFLTRAALSNINKGKMPFIFYLHPWEIDLKQPRISARWVSRFRHYHNIDKFESRLIRLINEFNFGTAWDVLCRHGLVNPPS